VGEFGSDGIDATIVTGNTLQIGYYHAKLDFENAKNLTNVKIRFGI
jgi:hypothetical protein